MDSAKCSAWSAVKLPTLINVPNNFVASLSDNPMAFPVSSTWPGSSEAKSTPTPKLEDNSPTAFIASSIEKPNCIASELAVIILSLN